MRYITRTIWILSLISLFTDTASEMLYPVMPIYLKSIGFSVVLIGILEGLAEATAGFSKGYFGKMSDNIGRRAPFVQLGYSLSAISKPMMAFFVYPLWIFFARAIDRIGKGIRTGARDAMLSDEATPGTKGKIFGFHRSMDTLGAVLGPLLALIFLYLYPGNYIFLFYIAFIPGVLAIIASFTLKDKKKTDIQIKKTNSFFSFLKYWKKSPLKYRKVLVGLLIFALFNSSDVFLLLKIKQAGLSDSITIGIYIFYNLVFALFAFPVGIIADKFGLRKTLIVGLVLYVIVYFGMGFASNMYIFIAMFFLYGVYAAATEGISKAWISNIVKKEDTATAIGMFTGFQSLCAMLASTIAGLIWFGISPEATFFVTGIVAFIVVIFFLAANFNGSKSLIREVE
jgi:MFS family permease